MLIKGEIKLKYDTSLYDRLYLYVKFKMPNKRFKTTINEVLVNTRNLSTREFLEECFKWLNKDKLMEKAKDMITTYILNYKRDNTNNYLNNNLKNKITQINKEKITFELEIKD